MNITNKFMSRKIFKEKNNQARINPLVKSAVYDYFTPDFFQSAVIAVSLFGMILFELLKEKNVLRQMDNPFIVFMGPAAVLSLGFMGIVDSVPHINWKYYAIVFPYNFKRHFGRTMLFLTGFFGFFITAFVITASRFSALLMLKYLFCMIILMSLSVNIAFTTGSMLIKALTLIIAVILIMWISSLRSYFLPIVIVPVLVTLIKAKIEYKEWYVL
jgi:hypothetical protein